MTKGKEAFERKLLEKSQKTEGRIKLGLEGDERQSGSDYSFNLRMEETVCLSASEEKKNLG